MERPPAFDPRERSPAIGELLTRALDVLCDAFGRAYGGATILTVDGTRHIDGLGSERAGLGAVFDLEPSVRERLARLEDWPEASDQAVPRLEERFEEVLMLSDDERRSFAEVMVATFLAVAEIIGDDPDLERLLRAKHISDRLPAPDRLFGKPIPLLDRAWYLGLHVQES